MGGPLDLIARADLVEERNRGRRSGGRGLAFAWRGSEEGFRRKNDAFGGENGSHGGGREMVSALVTEAGVLKGFGSIGIRQKG